jgi:hypothetical protein
VEVLEGVFLAHPRRLWNRPARLNGNPSDSARPDGARHPCCHSPSMSATVMRVTEIQAGPKQKRQDRSARHAEKQGRRARTPQLRDPMCPVPAADATADSVRGENTCSASRLRRSSRQTAGHLGNAG